MHLNGLSPRSWDLLGISLLFPGPHGCMHMKIGMHSRHSMHSKDSLDTGRQSLPQRCQLGVCPEACPITPPMAPQTVSWVLSQLLPGWLGCKNQIMLLYRSCCPLHSTVDPKSAACILDLWSHNSLRTLLQVHVLTRWVARLLLLPLLLRT